MGKMAKPKQKIAVVYMVAGSSSRFEGKIKQFAQVGPRGETLIEIAVQQAIKAGFNEIIFIVGEKTEEPFKEKFKAGYMNVPIFYAKQDFNHEERDRPWGTAQALVAAKEVVTSSFVVCNGDDIYGEKAMRTAYKFLLESKDETECCAVGYEVARVLPKKGKNNRAVFSTDKKGYVTNIKEIFEIEKDKLAEKGLTPKTLVSCNLFALKESVLEMFSERFEEFKKAHKGDRKIECLLPNELGELIKEKKIKMKLLSTTDKMLGVTNPDDEENVRKALIKK